MLDALKRQVRHQLLRYCQVPCHREAVLELLSRPGYVLHPDARCRAGVLALATYESVRGSLSEGAYLAAAAAELYVEAGFLFDNVADGQAGDSSPEELAIAIAVLNCGTITAIEAAECAEAGPAAKRVALALCFSCANACAGQYMDASLSRANKVSLEDSLRMTELKAGSCGRLAAGLGAAVATSDEALIGLCGELGSNLFTRVQLLDDLKDAFSPRGTSRDMTQSKKSVPLVFYNTSVAGGQLPNGRSRSLLVPECGQREDIPESPDASWARVFGAIVAEEFLIKAKANLSELSLRVQRIDGLETLVRSLEEIPLGVRAGR